MRLLLKAIAIVGCVTAASAAQAIPLFYDEADSGDIFARIGAIPVFNLGVGNNVIAGPLALLGFGLLALFVRRAGARSPSLPS
jgi:hypothetical protein